MSKRYDPYSPEVICPPEPKEPEPEWMEEFRREQEMREQEMARKKDAYERRTRDFRISPSAAVGGNPYPEEE